MTIPKADVTDAMVEAFQAKYREVAARYNWGRSWPAQEPSRELLNAAIGPFLSKAPDMLAALRRAKFDYEETRDIRPSTLAMIDACLKTE